MRLIENVTQIKQRIYIDEVIKCPRHVWVFFWYKCGKPQKPLDFFDRWMMLYYRN